MDIITKSPNGRSNFGSNNDCALVAVSNLLGVPYSKMFESFKEKGRRKNGGTSQSVISSFVIGYCKKFDIKYSIIDPDIPVPKGNFIFNPDRRYLVIIKGGQYQRKHSDYIDWKLCHATCVINGKWVDNGAMESNTYTHLDYVIEIED